jgi:CRISPR-associated protein Cas4
MKISVTFLTAYMYCKRKFFLEQIAGIAEPPKEVLVTGKIKHNVFDLANKQERGIVLAVTNSDKEQIETKYKEMYAKNLKNTILINKDALNKVEKSLSDAYKELWPFFEEEAKVRAENLHKFAAENNIFGKELWEKLTPKIESEVYVESENLQLKGKVDRIEVYADKIVPVELKTGSGPKEGVWEEHQVQIGAYMMLLEEVLGKKASVGRVSYLKDKEDREVSLNPFLRDEIVKLVKEVQEFIEKKNIPDFTRNRNKCESCGLKENCYYFET